MARVLYHLALTLDVERVCIGGGVASAGPAFLKPINTELDRLRRASALAREVLSDDLVQLLPPGSDAGTWANSRSMPVTADAVCRPSRPPRT